MFRCIKTIKLIWVFEIISLLLAGCASVPDTVKDRAENSSVTDSLESKADSDLVFDTVENVTKNAASVLGNKYQNIVLPERIDVKAADKAYVMSAGRSDKSADLTALMESFSKAFLGERADNAVPNPESENGLIAEAEGKYHIEVYNSGSLFAYTFDEQAAKRTAERPAYSYDLDADDISGIAYNVAGESYPLVDAVSFAEDYAAERLLPLLPADSEIRASYIRVFECGEGDHFYFIGLEHLIDGIPLSDVGRLSMNRSCMAGVDFRVGIARPGEVRELWNMRYPFIESKTEADRLITLESALSRAEQVLAPLEVYNVSKVTLKYCACQPADKTEFEYRPMWCLTLTQYPPQIYFIRSEKALYIDAVTGDVMLWDDDKGEFLFGEN